MPPTHTPPQPWPALDRLIETLRTAPARTGSVVTTVYGDAVLPRGGALALTDLLALMARLGAPEGVVRTAVSRLARDGTLAGRRTGRRSAYALTPRAEAEFRAAIPRIYGRPTPPWDGRLHLAFPTSAAARDRLPAFQPLAPGVLVSPWPATDPAAPSIHAAGPEAELVALAARAWDLDRLAHRYRQLIEAFHALHLPRPVAPLDAMAARIVLLHAWRRLALRDPGLPGGLLPPAWAGHAARARVTSLYAALAPASEAWLDAASSGAGPLPPGPDPAARWHPPATP